MNKTIKNNYRDIINLFINLYLFISTLIIATIGIINGAGEGQVGENLQGINYFKPYTIDSNIFLCIVALIFSIFLIIKLVKKIDIHNWVYKLYYIATSTITITILTVIFFLFPTMTISGGINKGLSLFTNDMFFYHLLNPILSGVSFFLNKQSFKFTIFDNLFCLIPIGIYIVVYTLNVAVYKNWNDFYGFTFGGKMYLVPFVILIMIGFDFLISFIYKSIKNKHLDK